MPKLNKRFVDALKSVTRDTLYRDSDLSGFALRVKPSGTATWVVQYRNSAGRTRKLALGRVGVLTPDEARQRARKALGRVADGADPSATRNAARGAMTVASLCRDYLAAADEGLVLGKNGRPKSETTLVSDRSRIASHIVPLLGRNGSLRRAAAGHSPVPACGSDGQDRQDRQSERTRCHPGHRRRRHGNPYRWPSWWHLRLRGS